MRDAAAVCDIPAASRASRISAGAGFAEGHFGPLFGWLAGTATYNERKTMYPNDEQFEETTVAKVRDEGKGWSIERADGWSFYVPAPSPVVPTEGMTARFYGKGIGFTVRGLFLDGQKVFYRTEAEDKEKHEIDTYGADAADWLKRWDDGGTCWSIEMGGFGPGYEQCIHITAA